MPNAASGQAARAGNKTASKRALSVKATLRLAFGLVLAGTLGIGAIALTQISRLNGATESIYTQGYVASRAAEETRGYLLRASRSQKMLLTASTAKERDDLGNEIERALTEIGKEQAQLAQYIDHADTDALGQQKRFSAALATWSRQPARLRQAREGAAARSLADELASRHAGRLAARRDQQAGENGR